MHQHFHIELIAVSSYTATSPLLVSNLPAWSVVSQ